MSASGSGGVHPPPGQTPPPGQIPSSWTTSGQTPTFPGQTHPPRWPLQRTVRILLECVLVDISKCYKTEVILIYFQNAVILPVDFFIFNLLFLDTTTFVLFIVRELSDFESQKVSLGLTATSYPERPYTSKLK